MSKGILNTIKGRLILSFVLIGFLILSLIGFTLYKIGTVVAVSREVSVNLQPSQIFTLQLKNGLHESNEQLNKYFLFQDPTLKNKRKMIWEEQIWPAMDSLKTLSAQWSNPEHLVLFNQIEKQIAVVHKQQNNIESAENIDMFQAQLNPMTDRMNKDFNLLYDALLSEKMVMRKGIYTEITSFKVIEGIFILIVMIAVWLLARFNRIKIRNSVKKVKEQASILGRGDIPTENISTNGDELEGIMDELNILADNLRNVKTFALEVGKGQFDNEIIVFDNQGEIGSSLANMRDSLRKVSEEDQQRSWANEGYAQFGELIRNNSEDLKELCELLISQLVNYLGANQGGIFIINDQQEDHPYMELQACYAYERRKYKTKQIHAGEGLVGQVWLERDSIYMTDLPQDYANITSGLGKATPSAILIVPLKINDEIYGALELASFQEFKVHEKEFVERVSETIASAVSSVKVNENTRRLLEESKVMTEQMRAQEEEMRQNMEELQATQEEMRRKSDEMQHQYARMNTILESSADGIITASPKGQLETVNLAATRIFGMPEKEMIGKYTSELLPEFRKLLRKFLALKTGETLTIRTLALNKEKGELPVEFSLRIALAGNKKILTAIVRDISQQVEMEKAQQTTIAELEEQQLIMKASEELMQNTVEQMMQKEQELQEAQAQMEKVSSKLNAEMMALNNAIAKMEFDADGKILDANSNFLEIMQYELNEVVGQSISLFFQEEDAKQEAFDEFLKKLKAGEVVEGSRKRKNKAGEIVNINTTYTPVFNAEGQLERVINITYDISKFIEEK